ncbi:NAC domain-containing protein 55 [Citrus sinensis]|uniref:NAC domain-containing protein 55 n=1 Tax=Citrus sinensis TaxID=2711 RepID=A0ACB8MC91_CITSI|nr:NAC domain-containing protein 55 [Citrus sinensis]
MRKYKDKDGNEKAECNHCKKTFDGSSKKGTTHLKNHLDRCRANNNKRKGGAAGDEYESSSFKTTDLATPIVAVEDNGDVFDHDLISLPPCFRFSPTDEELLVLFLRRKVAGRRLSINFITEIDFYKFEPWELPSKALFGDYEWFFFSPMDRKNPEASEPNRVTGVGYWEDAGSGTDKIITTAGRKLAGMKKALVYYKGNAPNGIKTEWIMHEYRLIEPHPNNDSSKLDDWILCRISQCRGSSAHVVRACWLLRVAAACVLALLVGGCR